MANEKSTQTKTSENMANTVVSGAKTAATVAKAAGKAAAGDIAGAIVDVLKDENLRRIIAALVIIATLIVYGFSMLGSSITGSVQNLEQMYEEQYETIFEQHAIEANGSTFALYTFDSAKARYEALFLTIKQYIENLFAGSSKYDNSALSDSERTVLLSENYQNTLNSIKDKEALVGEDGAMQNRIDLIKGRVEQRGEQLATIATAQYELTVIGMAIGEYLDNTLNNPVLFAGVDLENSSFNVHSEAFELSDIQALKILAAYSIQNDCNINEIDMWDLMNYCGWYSTETEALPTIDDEDSIYDATIEAHYGMEIGGVVDAGDTISTTVRYIDPPQVPFWDGSCAPQWYYEEIAQLRENNEHYDYYESKDNTEALEDMLHYETTEDGDIDISNFENLSKYQTFGIVDQVYVASVASLTVTRTEYETALSWLDEALSNLYGPILEKWKSLFGTKNHTTPAGNSVYRNADGTIGAKIYTSNSHQYFLRSSSGWTSERKTGSPGRSITFSGLSPNTTYTVYESWSNPATPSEVQNVSIDTFTTPNSLPSLQAYKIQLEMDVNYTARSVDEMLFDVLGLWPGNLKAAEVGTDEVTLYPEDHLDNELLKYTWTDTYTDPSGTEHTVEFVRQQGYQAEAYEDYIMAIAETMGYDTAGIFGSDVGYGNTIVEVAMAEHEYYHANHLHEGARYWNMAYEAGGIGVRYDGSVPWCVCFVMTCAWQCGLLEDGAAWERVNWIFYCSGLYSNLVDTGTGVGYCTAGSTYKPVPGDIVFFWTHVTRYNLAHVGIVKEVLDDGRLVTIEGNTSDSLEIRTYPSYLLGSRLGSGSGRVVSAYVHPNYPAPYLTNPLYETIGNYIHPTVNARLISDNGQRVFIAGLGRFRWSQMPAVLNMLSESYPELYKEELRTAYDANNQSEFIKAWNEIAKSNKKDKFKAAQRNILNKLYVDPVVQAIKAQTGFDWRGTTAREELLLGIVTTTDSTSACINLLKALSQGMDNNISDAEFLETMRRSNHLYNTTADYQGQLWHSDPDGIRTKWLKGIQALLKKVIKVEEERAKEEAEKNLENAEAT